MLDNRPNPNDKIQKQAWNEADVRHGVNPVKSIRAATLVIVPTIALRQWQLEISRFTAEGSLSVKVYHGSNRSTTIKDLKAADVVLTTYQVSGRMYIYNQPNYCFLLM